jgi:hypothetical protein
MYIIIPEGKEYSEIIKGKTTCRFLRISPEISVLESVPPDKEVTLRPT